MSVYTCRGCLYKVFSKNEATSGYGSATTFVILSELLALDGLAVS